MMNNIDLSFIIPIRLESNDRLKNCISVISYILNKIPEAKIYIKEVDSQSNFSEYALPIIKNFSDVSNLNYFYEESESNSLFHRTKYINDLFLETKSKVVWHYDIDVILPESTYYKTYNLIANEKYDFVYPFGCGIYQNAVRYSSEIFNAFMNSNFDTSILKQNSFRLPASVGFSQVFNRNSYIQIGMMNENFMSWGCEDLEFYYRIMCLEYKVSRVWDDIFHLEHSRTFNSHYNNPKFMDNENLWQWFRHQYKETIIKYYQKQEYLKNRII